MRDAYESYSPGGEGEQYTALHVSRGPDNDTAAAILESNRPEDRRDPGTADTLRIALEPTETGHHMIGLTVTLNPASRQHPIYRHASQVSYEDGLDGGVWEDALPALHAFVRTEEALRMSGYWTLGPGGNPIDPNQPHDAAVLACLTTDQMADIVAQGIIGRVARYEEVDQRWSDSKLYRIIDTVEYCPILAGPDNTPEGEDVNKAVYDLFWQLYKELEPETAMDWQTLDQRMAQAFPDLNIAYPIRDVLAVSTIDYQESDWDDMPSSDACERDKKIVLLYNRVYSISSHSPNTESLIQSILSQAGQAYGRKYFPESPSVQTVIAESVAAQVEDILNYLDYGPPYDHANNPRLGLGNEEMHWEIPSGDLAEIISGKISEWLHSFDRQESMSLDDLLADNVETPVQDVQEEGVELDATIRYIQEKWGHPTISTNLHYIRPVQTDEDGYPATSIATVMRHPQTGRTVTVELVRSPENDTDITLAVYSQGQMSALSADAIFAGLRGLELSGYRTSTTQIDPQDEQVYNFLRALGLSHDELDPQKNNSWPYYPDSTIDKSPTAQLSLPGMAAIMLHQLFGDKAEGLSAIELTQTLKVLMFEHHESYVDDQHVHDVDVWEHIDIDALIVAVQEDLRQGQNLPTSHIPINALYDLFIAEALHNAWLGNDELDNL